MLAQNQRTQFEQSVLPHLAAAYNLARWLTRNDEDAEDVVQDAYLRAFKFFGGFHGGDSVASSKAWLLAIVRNTCYTWLRQKRAQDLTTQFDEELHGAACEDDNPETLVLQNVDAQTLRAALERTATGTPATPVTRRATLAANDAGRGLGGDGAVCSQWNLYQLPGK